MRHHYFSKPAFRVKTAQDKGSKMAYTDLVNVKSCDDFIKCNVKIVQEVHNLSRKESQRSWLIKRKETKIRN